MYLKTPKASITAAVAIPILALTITGRLSAQGDDDEGWTSLFNGRNLDGWNFRFGEGGSENRGTFKVEDGILRCTGSANGSMITEKSYRDYTLQFEFAFDRPAGLVSEADFRGNSGVLIHVSEGPGIGVWPRSVEVQGMNRQLGVILPIPRNLECPRTFDAEASARARKPVGEWNRMKVAVRGGNLTISLNGVVVSTVSGCELTEGPIGLQSEGAPTRWRNIRIREQSRMRENIAEP